MTSIQFIVDEIKKVYVMKTEHAFDTYFFKETIDIDNIGEFACSVSLKLDWENWVLCANENYFVLEIDDDKYIVVYFADDRNDNSTEFVIRRCNNMEEYNDAILAIS
jgi:hypothetical protein